MDLISRQSTAYTLEPDASVYELGDLLLDYLKQIGVSHVFGIPGGAIEPLFNALARNHKANGCIKSVVTRHETGAAFMCDGFTSNSGILGVCCATTGPGTTNLITGVASAYANQVPMLVITAQTGTETWGRGAFQESSSSETGVDTLKLFEPITHFNSMVGHVNNFEQILTSAIRKAYQAQGPVHLSIPVDVFRSPAPVSKPSFDLSLINRMPSFMDKESVDKLIDLLTSGYKMVFVLGDSCAEAIDEIIEVATLLNILIVTTPHGKGLISPYHPQYRGVIGFAGHRTAYKVTCDESVRFIVAIGSRFGEWESNGWDKVLLSEKLIHISNDNGYFIRTPMARLHVLGNIQDIFNTVLDYLEDNSITDHSFNQSVVKSIEAPTGRPVRYFKLDESGKYNDDSTPIKPQRLMKLLPRIFPATTRYVADIGSAFAWTIHYMSTKSMNRSRLDDGLQNRGKQWSGSFRTCLEFSSMGWAIGSAIGTAFACPNDPVVCITGDGSFLMSGNEITVAQQHNLTLIMVVLNDSSLGMVKHGQKLVGAEPTGTELPEINYAKVARAMGIEAYTIRSPQDLMELDVKDICSRKSPTLLDIHIDKNEVPPIGVRTNQLKK